MLEKEFYDYAVMLFILGMPFSLFYVLGIILWNRKESKQNSCIKNIQKVKYSENNLQLKK